MVGMDRVSEIIVNSDKCIREALRENNIDIIEHKESYKITYRLNRSGKDIDRFIMHIRNSDTIVEVKIGANKKLEVDIVLKDGNCDINNIIYGITKYSGACIGIIEIENKWKDGIDIVLGERFNDIFYTSAYIELKGEYRVNTFDISKLEMNEDMQYLEVRILAKTDKVIVNRNRDEYRFKRTMRIMNKTGAEIDEVDMSNTNINGVILEGYGYNKAIMNGCIAENVEQLEEKILASKAGIVYIDKPIIKNETYYGDFVINKLAKSSNGCVVVTDKDTLEIFSKHALITKVSNESIGDTFKIFERMKKLGTTLPDNLKLIAVDKERVSTDGND